MALKRGTTDINDVYRGATSLSAIYRGTNLIWPTSPALLNTWLTDGLNFILNEVVVDVNVYSTNGLNIKLK
jgi:hypothetical protein